MKVSEGKPGPLGSEWDGRGVNFCVVSSIAERIDLCLFDERGHEERVALPGRSGPLFHGYVASLKPGQAYGYRVHGPWDPARGHLCGPERLLLDPCARAYAGDVSWDDSLFPFNPDDPDRPPPAGDTAPFVPRSLVVDTAFDWGGDRAPETKPEDTIIYEVHVKGMTRLHPEVPPEIRGTYAALAHPACIEHLTSLGVTAVELLPVQQFLHRRRLVDQGLRNYWGYDPVGFFAPHNEYAADRRPGGAVREFKEMVRALHAAGLEVLVDVVLNHTCEGGARGAVLSLKGLDNRAYYRLSLENGLHYVDHTGTHNTLDTGDPHLRRMILDALAYWAGEMRVDGFRFDLAPILARAGGRIDFENGFFRELRRDPVLRRAKLIAEPWDLGDGGYQAGRFPREWSEWNDKYRDQARSYWSRRPVGPDEFARRVSGSPDLFGASGRSAAASVNYVTCHDGYTLHDLVSYETKHNEANGEENRDGPDDNHSWNCGVEGPTDDGTINALRARRKRNLLATLLLSRGTPMLLGGDEIGRTQAGNNNAYCQDNEVSWFDWKNADGGLVDFVRKLIRLRKAYAVLRRGDWTPEDGGPAAAPPIEWLDSSGTPLHLESAGAPGPPPLQALLRGAGPGEGPSAANGGNGDLLILFNPTDGEVTFRIPPAPDGGTWVEAVNTARAADSTGDEAPPRAAGDTALIAHSLAVLIRAG